MIEILYTEWMKTKRTPVRLFSFLIPIVFSGLLVWYFSLRTLTQNTHIILFQAFFEIWTALVLPMAAGLLTGLMIHQEEMAGNFNGLLISKWKRTKLYLGKFIMLILLTLGSTFLSIVLLIIGLGLIHVPISLTILISSAFIAAMSTIPLLAFHLWISFAWGMGASIAFGGGGILIASLMSTSLGNTIWPYVPWAWPVRLAKIPVIISSTYSIHEILIALFSIILFLVIMLVGGVLWFKRWEGRKVYD